MTTKIIVVEDERIVGFNLQQRLIKLGYEVPAIAVNSEQALRAVKCHRPDIVLMDIHIEGDADGIQTAAEINVQYQTCIIYLTAYSEETTLSRARDTKPYGYLLKPFSERELHATIQMALERRDVEKALDESQTRLRMALTAAEMSEWEIKTVERNGQMVYVGQANNVLGYPEHEFCGSRDDFMELVHLADRKNINAALDLSQKSDSICNIEFRTLACGDSQRWLRLQGKILPSTNDQSQLVGIIQNITERKATEHSLRQAATVFEATQDGIVILDALGMVLSCNENFTTITGYDLADIVNDTIHFIDYDTLHVESINALEAVWLKGGKWRNEINVRRKNGGSFPALVGVASVERDCSEKAHFVLVVTDLSDIRGAEQRLQFLAHHDHLTLLPNRLLTMERLAQVLLRAKRNSENIAVLFLDLDHFKWVNDSLGHNMGDDILKVVGERVKEALRESDHFGRIGGDEFLIVLDPVEQLENIAVVADKVASVIAMPVMIDGHTIEISCSIGISSFPEDGSTCDQLIHAADTAMYSAKAKGRNCYDFFTPIMMAKAKRYLALNHELHRGFNDGELCLYYQPQLSLSSQRIIGVEALIRWQHPRKGLLGPEDIIPIAEESGLISELGDWILAQACQQIVQWKNLTSDPLLMAVNVSSLQFLKPKFLQTLEKVLSTTGVDPDWLEIEVTESALQNDERTIATLTEMQRQGMQVAIDDFGTGYSCLSSLKLLPINKLKIDKSFIKDIPTDQNDVAITELIIAIAHKLKLKVIAEGVENVEQLTFLRALGCDEAQGYYYFEPLPAMRILPLLISQATV